MTEESPQILTHLFKETEVYAQMTEQQKKDLDEFLYLLWYLQGLEEEKPLKKLDIY